MNNITKENSIQKILFRNLSEEYIAHTEFKDSPIGKIPVDWEVKNLEEISKIVPGGTPSSDEESYWDGDILWATPTDITSNGKYIESTERTITVEGLKNSSANLLKKNSILMTSRATIAECSINLKEMATNQGFKSFEVNENIDVNFVYYIIIFNKQKFIKLSSGSTFLEISKKEVEKIQIQIPSYCEQKKIAKILSTVDNHIDEVDGIIEDLKELKKGLMQKLLTEGIGHTEFKDSPVGRIPVEWEVKRLEECLVFQNGKAFYSEGYSSKGKKVVDLMNISSEGKFQELENKQKYVNNDMYNKYFNFQLSKENLIMAMSDMSNKLWIIGRTAIIPKDNMYILNQRIGKLTPKNNMTLLFANYATNSENFLKQLRSLAKGTAQFYLNTGDITSALMVVPFIEEQRKISNIFKIVDDIIEIYIEEKGDLIDLKRGLMQQLLTGKTRVKIDE